MKDLTQTAMLVNIRISQWSGKKHDKQVSREVDKEHNAQNAGRYNKFLIDEKELGELQKVSSAARSFLYDNTLPWGNNGDRLLTAENYFSFVAEVGNFTAKFENLAGEFVTKYPKLKEDARLRLNGLFKESDYPHSVDIHRKFKMEATFMPISDVSDFRVKMSRNEQEQLKAEMEKEFHTRIHQANQDIWKRIQSVVASMVERLSDKDKVFRDSLITNISELVEILPKLNFTGDPHIADIIIRMKQLLVDPDQLRKNEALRESKADEAQAILDKICAFLD